MAREFISRRRVLRGIATGAVGTAALGNANAELSTRFIIGTNSPAGAEAAKAHASSVSRVLDLGNPGETVVGHFPEQALDGLRRRKDVRYVERDVRVMAIGA